VRLEEVAPEAPARQDVDPTVRIDLQRALMRLAKGQRVVVVLRFFYDLSIEQTAECLNCTAGTVKSQTARGLAALRGLLGAEFDHPLRSHDA
jgi:RNA polymerase sigma factor (sigma-70 family)